MPAAEETWRNQQKLNVVFAISSVAMLGSIVWMMADDHWREWKRYQRRFQRLDQQRLQSQYTELSAQLDAKRRDELQARIAEGQKQIDAQRREVSRLQRELRRLRGREQGAKQALDFAKADLQEARSKHDQAVRDGASEATLRRLLQAAAEVEKNRVRQRQLEFEAAEAARKTAQTQLAAITKDRDEAEAEMKELRTNLDRVQAALAKARPSLGKRILTWPVIDAFNSPLKIFTVWLPELPQPVGSFGEAARFDRCTTCHLAIDRTAPGSAVEAGWLAKSADNPGGYDHPFVTHPRLDLYVGATSPHPLLEFGCTTCHGGQGSDTSFVFASHTPNTIEQMHAWRRQHQWYDNHHWDYPQWPRRFVEASCIQCHHSVTELEASGRFGKTAATVTQGYHLIRTYGCFGCHDISGYSEGRPVGPDLRLEPPTPEILARSLPELKTLLGRAPSPTPSGVAALVAATRDPAQIPGKLRKVGPSLARIAEKTTRDWAYRWIKSPKSYQPRTRMPHFFGLFNNGGHPAAQADSEAPGGRAHSWRLAHTEIHAMVHYLFRESETYEAALQAAHQADPSALAQEADQVRPRLDELKVQLKAKNLTGKERQALTKEQDEVLEHVATLEQTLAYRDAALLADPPSAGDAKNGQTLFLQKGCLACHSHRAFPTDAHPLADADFGPDLSNVAAKLLPGDDGSKWLFHWLRNPRVHHPRGYMPNLQLTDEEAADIAAWLLEQPGRWAQEVEMPAVDEPALDELVLLYLRKALTVTAAEEYLDGNKGIPADKTVKGDERELLGPLDNDKKLAYLGRKSLARYGCFGCHDIPGFETAKPIGTELNDWGRKDTDLLAFERVDEYLEEVEHASQRAEQDPDFAFYHHGLLGHKRYGFIWQKLHEPRSFDYEKLDLTIKPYDDRLRMPRFTFAADAKANDRAIESIATFVLGLVAQPPPDKFVYQSKGLERSRLEGFNLLVRFNCVGCHVLQMPQFTFNVDPALHEQLPDRSLDYAFLAPEFTQDQIERSRQSKTATVEGLVMAADDPDAEELVVDLWQPALVMGQAWRVGESIPIAKTSVTAKREATGGKFALLLVEALVQAGPPRDKAWGTVPPPLLREGQKVQTPWLYQFLLNPTSLRPAALLRMPAFNLNPDEARSLAEYFAAADSVSAYEALAQTSPGYLARRDAEHATQAGPGRGYLQDAYKILTNAQLCLKCHVVGGSSPAGEPQDRGPDLTEAPRRFRPDWLVRWLANPKRVLPYTGMPQNFPNGQTFYQEEFPGSGVQQLGAVGDVLLNYHKVLETQLAERQQTPQAARRAGGE